MSPLITWSNKHQSLTLPLNMATSRSSARDGEPVTKASIHNDAYEQAKRRRIYEAFSDLNM